MLRDPFEAKKTKPLEFQVLFLKNDPTKEVEIHEVNTVDFPKVQEHLEQGGSVFITSKKTQKITPPKTRKKTSRKNTNTRQVTAFHLESTP